jgi:hypothetical protein
MDSILFTETPHSESALCPLSERAFYGEPSEKPPYEKHAKQVSVMLTEYLRLGERRIYLVTYCLSGCFSKSQAVV